MPPKPKNPASFVKHSPQKVLTEQNKPRQHAKQKHIAESSIEQSKAIDHAVQWSQESAVKILPTVYVNTHRFELVVNGVPYTINSIPFLLNENICFRVHINGNETCVFSWDGNAGKFCAIDDKTLNLPEGVAEAIFNKILN